MYNNEFIEKFIPKLTYLANKYANGAYDEDELFSEGQLYLCEYLKEHQKSEIGKKLYHNAYTSVKYRLKTFSNTKDTIQTVPIDENTLKIQYLMKNDTYLIQILHKVLSDREFDIITKYYGFYSNEMSISEISKEYCLSVSRISMLKRRAERNIRYYIKSRKIDSIDDICI